MIKKQYSKPTPKEELYYGITKDVMEHYEIIRASGITNMYNQYQVAQIANKLRFYCLAFIANDRGLYGHLLMNFAHYMKKYGIKQTKKEKDKLIVCIPRYDEIEKEVIK